MPKHKAKAESSSSGSDKAEELSSSDSGPDDVGNRFLLGHQRKNQSQILRKNLVNQKIMILGTWVKTRSVRLTEFNRKWYVDIREFYSADGELKPGRKGIMLTMEQWQKLKGQLNSIDDAIKKHV
ncbi:hypothetical protein NQ317_011925 [Molorchus minor]|uniref:Transcriptional coactivator p15 (PC4) C-terminal domain-containing protein n=1 Tax=Molorchus minor TaxID=1323400 RepID=A0ABQ9JDE6_9CUCU|nr:hypothetical protein NQ317_011925 [Molorchus minor]